MERRGFLAGGFVGLVGLVVPTTIKAVVDDKGVKITKKKPELTRSMRTVTGKVPRQYNPQLNKVIWDNYSWATILKEATDQNILVYDYDAVCGQLTRRMMALMKITMRRNYNAQLTNLFMSPEIATDFVCKNGMMELPKFMNVELHECHMFGEESQNQKYFTEELEGSVSPGDVEIILGMGVDMNDRIRFLLGSV